MFSCSLCLFQVVIDHFKETQRFVSITPVCLFLLENMYMKLHTSYGIFSGPYFPVFGLDTEKYGPQKTPSGSQKNL